MHYFTPCPKCGEPILHYKNPVPAVDILIRVGNDRLVFIKRKNEPVGWSFPGGFIDYGEKAEDAATREALEETSLHIVITGLLGVYSSPERDPRFHTLSAVYIAEVNPDYGLDTLRANDDAAEAAIYPVNNPPSPLVFDHRQILDDYLKRFRDNPYQGI